VKTRPMIFCGARIADGSEHFGEYGELLVVDGHIAEIGQPGMGVPEGTQIIDATDRLILPGLVNSHTHSHLAVAKGLSEAWTLELHLHNGPWTGGGQNLEDRRLLAQASAVEMLTKGCTAAYDLVLELPFPTPEGLFATAQGYLDAGMRVVVAPMMADRTFWRAVPGLLEALPRPLRGAVEKIEAAPYDVALTNCEAAARNWPYELDRARLALAPTIPFHCSDPFWEGCHALSEEHGLGIHCHLAESAVQKIKGRELYGRSLTSHLDSLGLIGPRFTGAHGIWLEPGDLEILAARGAAIAHNPTSNFRLGSGMANVLAMRRAGVAVGLGTDACSCSDHQNLFEAMRLACYLTRTATPDPDEWLSAAETLAMATAGGARVLGMEDLIGRIAVGHAADLVLLDLTTTNYMPLNRPLAQLVFCEEGRSIDRVYVGGRKVVEGGRITTLDYDKLRRRMNDRAIELQAQNADKRASLAPLESFIKNFCIGLSQNRERLYDAS